MSQGQANPISKLPERKKALFWNSKWSKPEQPRDRKMGPRKWGLRDAQEFDMKFVQALPDIDINAENLILVMI